MSMIGWAEKEVELVCNESLEDKDADDYANGCYRSALKAFKSLCEDGHSGMSIGFTLNILNRLVKGKPLTSIKGTDEEWEEVERDEKLEAYQNKRYFGLFKNVYADGKVVYRDVNRTIVYYDGEETGFHSGHASKIVDELYPITLPYMPTDTPYKVYCNCLENPTRNEEIREYTHLINPKSERKELNKCYIISQKEIKEITKEEFEEKAKIYNELAQNI